MAKKDKVQKTTEELLEEISNKLNCVICLLGLQLSKEGTQKEHIKRLKKAGFNNKEIALMLGTTSKIVSVTLAPSKRGDKKVKGKSNAKKEKGR